MKRARTSTARTSVRPFRLAMIAGLLAAGAMAPAAAATMGESAPRSIAALSKLSGETVAEARTAPETPMAIQGYRVERIALPQPATVRVEGRRVEARDVLRVTLYFGRALTVRDQAFSLAIDGRWCGSLSEAPDLLTAQAICFDSALLKDGSSLGATYRSVRIQQPADGEVPVAPDASFTGDEPIHYSSVRLQLGGQR